MNDIESLTAYARESLDSPPLYHGTAAVRCRLKGVVLWCGSEWAATTFGLEKTNGAFRIRARDLWFGEDTIGWIAHMSALDEVTDISDFSVALRLARGFAAGRLKRASLRPSFADAG